MFNLGKYITMKREEKGMSQRELAKFADVSNTMISNLEKNRVKNPTISALRAIEKTLGLEEDHLVNLAYPKENHNEIKKREYTKEELMTILDEGLIKDFEEEKIKMIRFVTELSLDEIQLHDLKLAVEAIKKAKKTYKNKSSDQ